MRRGYEVFEDEDGGPDIAWPRCEIDDCPNCVCIHASPSLCYPHGVEFGAIDPEQFERDRVARCIAAVRRPVARC